MTPRIARIEWDGSGRAELAARLRAMAPPLDEVTADVREILARVRRDGDAAVRELTLRFDELAPERLRVDAETLAAAAELLEPPVREALRVAGRNIAAVARAEAEVISRPAIAAGGQGQAIEVRHEPVGSAGIYAPGGTAALASSVLMCCLPARIAGVERIAVATPPGPDGRPAAAVLAACALLGVEEVYAIGGAQAIAAFAYGTESVPAVDVVAGPGNRYVAEAKRLVYGHVGVDGVIAGPSELMVVADGTAVPEQLALDLCAQAEHGGTSPLVLASPDVALLDAIAERVVEVAEHRPSVGDAPLALVATPGIELAIDLADAFAPEHLELAFASADEAAARSRIAGCVFVGAGGATAFGDYAAGSNHVLPTGGAARFAGPLGPAAFMRRTSVVSIPGAAATALAPHVAALADAEGLPVHGESAEARMQR
ncbi:MAG: histidinol dehydrogenase [Solirubrobacterales bacterium]|nr:histidinol dehydrogenase [Solirubrobacterales bacterium]